MPAVPDLVLQELERVGAPVADVHPVAARRGRADLPHGVDPQAALAAEPLPAGGDRLAGRLAGAAMQLLAGQAEQIPRVGFDGQGVVALVATAAAVADRPQGGERRGAVRLQDDLMGGEGVVHQA